jgi:hypothetical protein
MLMMNFEIASRAAALALPAISREHLQAQLLVGRTLKPLSAHG